MQGIRYASTLNDKPFMRYFSLVQDAAREQGCVFFVDCGEGHDLITDEIDCQDLSGWLVPADAVADFEPMWRSEDWDELTNEQDDFMVTAVWSGTPENISVRFEPMP